MTKHIGICFFLCCGRCKKFHVFVEKQVRIACQASDVFSVTTSCVIQRYSFHEINSNSNIPHKQTQHSSNICLQPYSVLCLHIPGCLTIWLTIPYANESLCDQSYYRSKWVSRDLDQCTLLHTSCLTLALFVDGTSFLLSDLSSNIKKNGMILLVPYFNISPTSTLKMFHSIFRLLK